MRGRRYSLHDDLDIEEDGDDPFDPGGSEPDSLDRITKEQFLEGRDRRFGNTNPERLDIPFWNAMVKSGQNAWSARSKFNQGEPDAIYAERQRSPVWCDQRFGETETRLPDGTLVQIGGEHEDFYDPDFMIYNDVIVYYPPADGKAKRGWGTFAVFGYPRNVFPPLDFHSATYVYAIDSIVIVGNLSAPDAEEVARQSTTPVYVLRAGTWVVRKQETTGEGPGIIWRHKATIMDNVLRICGDRVAEESGQTMRKVFKDGEVMDEVVEFSQIWTLDVGTWVWTTDSNGR